MNLFHHLHCGGYRASLDTEGEKKARWLLKSRLSPFSSSLTHCLTRSTLLGASVCKVTHMRQYSHKHKFWVSDFIWFFPEFNLALGFYNMSVDTEDTGEMILKEMKDKRQPALALWAHGIIQISLDNLCLQ